MHALCILWLLLTDSSSLPINFSVNHRGSEFFRFFANSKVAKFDLRYLDSGFLGDFEVSGGS